MTDEEEEDGKSGVTLNAMPQVVGRAIFPIWKVFQTGLGVGGVWFRLRLAMGIPPVLDSPRDGHAEIGARAGG